MKKSDKLSFWVTILVILLIFLTLYCKKVFAYGVQPKVDALEAQIEYLYPTASGDIPASEVYYEIDIPGINDLTIQVRLMNKEARKEFLLILVLILLLFLSSIERGRYV